MRRDSSRASWEAGSPSTRRVIAPASTSSVTGVRGPAMSRPSPWPPLTGRRRTSWSPTSARLMRTRSRAGADPERHKAMHDAKGPLLALWARGWDLAGLTSDTQLAAYLTRPDQRTFDLADLTIRYLKRELRVEGAPDLDDPTSWRWTSAMTTQVPRWQPRHRWSAPGRSSIWPTRWTSRSSSAMAPACSTGWSSRCCAPWRGWSRPGGRGRRPSGGPGGRVRCHGQPCRQRRVPGAGQADQPRLTQAAPGCAVRRAGNAEDPAYPHRLYDRRGGAAAALRQDRAPVLAHLLVHRDAIRLKQTVEGLLKAVADDGRIHTTYAQTIAATGRLSSTDPNLQNIPIRTEEGRRIRQAFVVGEGYDALMSADYSQIEMRIMAHASEDESLIEAFKSGMDFHTVTASRVFGVEPGQVTPAERAKIKAMNYGLAYGLSAYGLSQQLNIEVSEAKALMDEYFERFGDVRTYLHSLVADARRTEYTETILGRRRYLPDLMSDNRQRREMAERMALNAPIQGSAADIIKVAMLDVEKALDDTGMRSRMLLQVHDELVFEVGPGSESTRRAGAHQDGSGCVSEGAAGGLGRGRAFLA